MRTAAKIVSEIRAADPDTEVSEYYIRQLVKEGAIPVVWAGNKALINLDDVLDLLRVGTGRPDPEPQTVGGIRRVEVSSARPWKPSGQKERLRTQPADQSV